MNVVKLLLAACCLFGFTTQEPITKHASAGCVEVRIKGIEQVKGVVEVALFDSRRRWLKSGKSYAKKRVEVDGRDVVVKFENLPFGKYAIVSYHDINRNNNFDRNWVGIPKEPYAMTRKAKSKLRKPKFKEMSFELSDEHHLIETKFRSF